MAMADRIVQDWLNKYSIMLCYSIKLKFNNNFVGEESHSAVQIYVSQSSGRIYIDQSSAHAMFADDALSVKNINVKPVEKNWRCISLSYQTTIPFHIFKDCIKTWFFPKTCHLTTSTTQTMAS